MGGICAGQNHRVAQALEVYQEFCAKVSDAQRNSISEYFKLITVPESTPLYKVRG